MKCTVIIPSFNKGGLLLRTLQSVTAAADAQTEIIVIDDHSTDPKTLAAYKKLPNSVRLLTNPGKGVAAARNYGLSQALSDIIVFLDNDDGFSANFIAEGLATLNSSPRKAGFIYPDIVTFDERSIGWRPTPPFQSSRLKIYNYIPVTCLYRKAALEKVGGFSSELSSLEDWDLFLRLTAAGFTGQKFPKDKPGLLFYRISQQSRNNSFAAPKARIKARAEVLKKNHVSLPLQWLGNIASALYGRNIVLAQQRERAAFEALTEASRKPISSAIDELR